MDRARRMVTFRVSLSAVDDLYPNDQVRLVAVRKQMIEGVVADFRRLLVRELKNDEVISGSGPELKENAK